MNIFQAKNKSFLFSKTSTGSKIGKTNHLIREIPFNNDKPLITNIRSS
jgi:hypothetical protein